MIDPVWGIVRPPLLGEIVRRSPGEACRGTGLIYPPSVGSLPSLEDQLSPVDCTYDHMYTRVVPFEWDPNKAAANVRKHGVQFSEALGVFSDDYAITIKDDESEADEQRFVTLGMGIKGRVLAVAYCYSGENIRIISARTAGRPEREQYEAQR